MNACVTSHFQSTFLSMLSFPSEDAQPLIQMFRCGILLLQRYLDSGLHGVPWVRRFWSRISLSIFIILSLICLYLSSSSSFIFAMVEFIPWSCVTAVSLIVCRNVSIFCLHSRTCPSFRLLLLSRFPSFRPIISLCKNIALSLDLVDLLSLTPSSFLFFLFLLLIRMSPSCHFSVPPISLRDISIVVSASMLLSSIVFLSLSTSPW